MFEQKSAVKTILIFLVTWAFSNGLSLADVSTPIDGKSGNIVRNASFELEDNYNGGPMLQYPERDQVLRGAWSRIGSLEGWMAEGPDSSAVKVVADQHVTGKRSLLLDGSRGKPVSVISAFERYVDEGPVTLSVWVKTSGARGRIDLDLVNSWDQDGINRSARLRKSVDIPADSDWVRLTVTAHSPARIQAIARIWVDAGKVYVDDVQIEERSSASAFNVRPEEWLRLEIAGAPDSLDLISPTDGGVGRTEPGLPKWIEGDSSKREVIVYNDSRLALRGNVALHVGAWNMKDEKPLAVFDAGKINPGGSRAIAFDTKGLSPNAYLISLHLSQNGKINPDGDKDFHPDRMVGGVISYGTLDSRMAARFVVVTKVPPTKLFGVGNGMLTTSGNWWGGYSIKDYQEARELGITCSRGGWSDDLLYITAAGGVPTHAMGGCIDTCPKGAPFANPVTPAVIDLFNPQGLALMKSNAENMGREFAANPMVYTYEMDNEAQYLNTQTFLCPTVYADADFRQWCMKKYGDLNTLNKRWATNYTDWGQVEQVISARMLSEAAIEKKTGAEAIDWLAASGGITEQTAARMQVNPAKTLDWLRWKTYSTLRFYSTYRARARKYDKKTLYSTNLAWPEFWPQMFMPFIRAMDVTMPDMCYTSGLPRGLGNPYEMMDMIEMAESTDPRKPIWGIEVYYEPQWPAEFVALQSWGLLAHGMTNDLTFAWKPYADAGDWFDGKYRAGGPRSWEKPDAPPMWMLIDTDGTKLSAYYTYKRSVGEISSFHRKFDGTSLKRAHTDIALYVSPDTAEYVVFESLNKPWTSSWQRTRNNLVYILRLNGITVDYVDDVTLPSKPGRYKKIVVPASYILSQEAAKRIADFARAGGTVILAGPSGLCDPWLRPYVNLGGTAWSDLDWKAPGFKMEYARVKFAASVDLTGLERGRDQETSVEEGVAEGVVHTECKTFRGVDFGNMTSASPIKDLLGDTIGSTRKWGKGTLIACGILPDVYEQNPHPYANQEEWVRQLIEWAP